MFLCTGNAARSVMAGAALARLAPGARIVTAGTHVVEGQPTSWRTRDALAALGLRADGHRSRQLRETDVRGADLVVGFAREHVEFVRRVHPDAAARTATLRRLARDLPGAPGATLAERVAALDLGRAPVEAGEEDVADPAGGDAEVFAACAREVLELVGGLAAAIASTTGEERDAGTG